MDAKVNANIATYLQFDGSMYSISLQEQIQSSSLGIRSLRHLPGPE